MTNQELIDKHAAVNDSSYKNMHHAKISTLFAISVLEEVRDSDTSAPFYYEDAVKKKVTELKSLIK